MTSSPKEGLGVTDSSEEEEAQEPSHNGTTPEAVMKAVRNDRLLGPRSQIPLRIPISYREALDALSEAEARSKNSLVTEALGLLFKKRAGKRLT